MKEIAGELVQLYAARENQKGYVYGPDTVWQREFEEMFPFEVLHALYKIMIHLLCKNCSRCQINDLPALLYGFKPESAGQSSTAWAAWNGKKRRQKSVLR